MTKKSISLWAMILLYFSGGINHFINPHLYFPLIPDYLPFHQAINLISGVVEILFSLLLIPGNTRKWAAYGIILMLSAFIPAHIYFIKMNSCAGELCVSPWIAWVRLLIIHPLLVYWAWSNGR